MYVCMYVCRYISTYEDEILEEYECGANRCVPYCDNDCSALYTYIKAYGDYRICVGKVMPPICVYIKERVYRMYKGIQSWLYRYIYRYRYRYTEFLCTDV